MSGERQVHGIRIRRLRLRAGDREYDVDFRESDPLATTRSASRGPRPMSVIAGEFGTGKTTILEFVDYCLGASDHPRHPEIMPKVRAATLEVELSGTPHLIERAVGEPSTFAYVGAGRLDDPTPASPQRRPLRPAGNPGSLSSLLLAHCKLEGVRLHDELATDPLSFRDLMWLCFLTSDRLDDRNLLFENVPMKNLKLRQVVDVVFDVHDDRSVELGRRIRTLEADLSAARDAYLMARSIVDEQRLGDHDELAEHERAAKAELAECALALAALDARARAGTTFAEGLRSRHHAAAAAAHKAAELLRDRETQLVRMTSLRATYAEDVSKLVMLTEAGRLFPPMRLEICPSCLTPVLPGDRRCATCQAVLEHHLPGADPTAGVDVTGELRAARARLAELTRYLDDLQAEVPRLRAAAEQAQEAETRAAAEVDTATAHVVSPYLAERDSVARRREAATSDLQRAVDGQRLTDSLQRRAAALEAGRGQLAGLREELRAARRLAPAGRRAEVLRRVGDRYRDLLGEWRYPRPGDAFVREDLTPCTRGEPYTSASPGGRTLIALAWQLAIFETAWETRSSHPGFLLLDSPQKNLGRTEGPVVERVYRHLERWLAGPGQGAQIIVADNAPPKTAAADVVTRFSRQAGLID
ncbi:DNA recombination protein RecN [Actinoplanes sp. NPDC051411]|uniref:DNA recombination protein RecN n=1 Tax=Actinoplanes sp. NPDC051411 TaxID=3155522 RepID=UPI0034198189